jgi:hypothetical protein
MYSKGSGIESAVGGGMVGGGGGVLCVREL